MDERDARMKDIITLAEEEFGPFADDGIIHLNHAGISPWPHRTHLAIRQFSEQNTANHKIDFNKWEHQCDELRGMARDLVNSESAGEIALIKNTSEGLSFVAQGIHWQPTDNIVFGRQEFPSNRIVWEATARQFGVELRCVDLYDRDSPEEALLEQIDSDTRLLAVSSVQYAHGHKMALEKLGAACRQNGTLFCVDAIQSLGALPFDVRYCQIDFAAADGHKWLLAPEGVGIFYCRKEQIERLTLRQFGWASIIDRTNYDALFSTSELYDWQLASTARRFECGSLNNIGINALHASIDLLLDIGIADVAKQIAAHIDYLLKHIDHGKYQVLTPLDAAKRAGILNITPRGKGAKELFHYLSRHDVLCAYRGGGVRFSPHFYTPRKHLDTVLEHLRTF